jgi:hypothetical protein
LTNDLLQLLKNAFNSLTTNNRTLQNYEFMFSTSVYFDKQFAKLPLQVVSGCVREEHYMNALASTSSFLPLDRQRDFFVAVDITSNKLFEVTLDVLRIALELAS